MRKIFIALTLLITSCSIAGAPVPSERKYVPGTEDLPLFSGFIPSGSNNVAYDSESGRIINAEYISYFQDMDDVQEFYRETLPELGWRKTGSYKYKRDGELLHIVITQTDEETILKFVIRPVKKKL